MTPSELWSQQSVIGDWLRTKPALIKIGKTLFTHAGISPRVLEITANLTEIDKKLQESFLLGNSIQRTLERDIVHGGDGVLFYRGLAKDMTHYGLYKQADQAFVDKMLLEFSAERIAIGHTIVDNIDAYYNGKVLRVDVDHTNNDSQALLYTDSQWYRLHQDGRLKQLRVSGL